MNITAIILAGAVVGIVGLLIAVLLGVASEAFKVPVDEKAVAVREALPGNNCGGCGYAGCDGLAAAIAKGEAPVNACPVGGAAAAAEISSIMGVEAGEAVKMVAFVKCAGTCDRAKDKYEYVGTPDCVAAATIPGGGAKACSFGCTGLGTCVKACQFDAIHVVDGVAVVDKDKCVACGKCASMCPKGMIEMVPYDAKVLVQCNSHDMGKNVKAVCSAGCIGCQLCKKTCKFEAVEIDRFLAHIDYSKCKNCTACAMKCPTGIIQTPKKPAGVKFEKPAPKAE
ncbi:MAG: RnfABCDGE type electron transport complex subunit B [Lachnospiraceae bacterium]|nr:RnfABCDGE type electron transport complex subunit B [Lachnospiraceae bacterium]